MLSERMHCLVPTSIRQVEPSFSKVEQVRFFVKAQSSRRQVNRLRSAVSILVLFAHGVEFPELLTIPMNA
jgi:hypothetical protein